MTDINTKGSLIAAFANGNLVEMWFQSPDGDSSDSQTFSLRCKDAKQAEWIASVHRSKWGVPNYGDPRALTSERF